MAEAKITLNVTPQEFDLVRGILNDEHRRCLEVANDRHTDAALKNEHRRRAVQINDILAKLQ